MTFPMHSFRDPRHSTLSLILLAAFAGIAGCGTDQSPDVMVSPPGWVVVPSGGQHAKSATLTYISNGGSSSCIECHGGDLSGGTSKVSCFGNPAGCHHGPVAGWVAAPPAAQNHGVAAKRAPGSSGFASCQICHGSNFTGSTIVPTCLNTAACHGAGVVSPHARKPWRGSPYTHTDTVEGGNVPICYQCHAYTGTANPNNPHVPPTPASTGTAPGCFNGTMCHNQAAEAPHITGSTWLDAGTGFHGTDAKSDLTHCQGCHGTPGTINFNGGSAPTACSTCHTTSKAHPTDWQGLRTINGVTITHRTSGNRDVACAICHNTTGPGAGPNPSAPSCFSSSHTNSGGQTRPCHSGGPAAANHLTPFDNTDHYSVDSTTFQANCINCHADTGVSPNSAAPLCTVCHQAGSPLTSLNCTSCHGDPPSGATYPNVAGKHAIHGALPGVGVCNPCHTGLEAGSLEHYNRANALSGKNASRVPPGDIAFLAKYNAKSGPAAFNAANRTCSNVICHGGQATPDWQTATADAVDVPNACLSCHVSGTTQYNSYFSGEHDRHIGAFGLGATTCKRCHDVAKVNVSGHFQNLTTPAFEQPASATILLAVGYNGNTCNPQAGGLTGCHGNKKW